LREVTRRKFLIHDLESFVEIGVSTSLSQRYPWDCCLSLHPTFESGPLGYLPSTREPGDVPRASCDYRTDRTKLPIRMNLALGVLDQIPACKKRSEGSCKNSFLRWEAAAHPTGRNRNGSSVASPPRVRMGELS
jgi:hypothetical protein